MKIKVALVQMPVVAGKPETNLEYVENALEQASSAGCDMAFLPELWATGYNLKERKHWAAAPGKGLFEHSRQLAIKHSLYLQAGSLLSVRRWNYYNTATLYGPDGKRLGSYDKMHLFGLMGEPEYLSPGRRRCVYSLPWGPAGQSICYDLRFPELYRGYAKKGCNMVFVPAQWPSARVEHWKLLLRARAVENQCFVVAVNRVGTFGDTQFPGASAIIAPDGTTVAEGGADEELIIAELDMNQVEQMRKDFPVLEDM